MIQMVFFDAGDTLLCPKPSYSGLAAETLAQRGHNVTEIDVRRLTSRLSEHFATAAAEQRFFSCAPDESRAFWTAYYTDMLELLSIEDAGAPEALFASFTDLDNYKLFEDALPCIEELSRRGIRTGVISNFETWLRDLLVALQVDRHFDVLAISGELGFEKPDPRIFKWALAEAGLDPSVCLHVGDQPYFDAQPAIECGMRPILINRRGRWDDLDDYEKIESLSKLPDLI